MPGGQAKEPRIGSQSARAKAGPSAHGSSSLPRRHPLSWRVTEMCRLHQRWLSHAL